MRVLDALRGLTTRGRSFLAAAAAAGLSALVLGEKDLLRVAVLLAVLPLLAALYVGRSRYRLACTRTCQPQRVPVGATARVQLKLQNLSRWTTGTLLLEDKLPYALGSRPRLVMERLGAHQASSVAYTVRTEVRGRYEIGPLVVRLTDPFGLCELSRSFPSVDPLIVTPEVVPLPSIRPAGEHTDTGESRARTVAVHGEDDAATREYRHGDDLRRVHWRSTARVGELMVRREEQPWESRATVVLDPRAAAHRGEGPTASFEWAVSAAASIAVHLRRAGYRVRLISTGIDVSTDDFTGDGLVLDQLAEVRTEPDTDVASLAERVRQHGDIGLVIGLFGLLTSPEAEVLGNLRGGGTGCVAFALDTTTWLHLPTVEREQADAEHHASVSSLLESGWRVISVRHGAKLNALWPQVGRRGTRGSAWRAAMAETVAGGLR
jgi:uncharacterized protein (DUF58 family)